MKGSEKSWMALEGVVAQGVTMGFAAFGVIMAIAQFNLSPFVAIGLVAAAGLSVHRNGDSARFEAAILTAMAVVAFLDKTGTFGRAAAVLLALHLVVVMVPRPRAQAAEA